MVSLFILSFFSRQSTGVGALIGRTLSWYTDEEEEEDLWGVTKGMKGFIREERVEVM